MGWLRERVALWVGATLLGVSVAAVIARRPFRRLAAAVTSRRGAPRGAGQGGGPSAGAAGEGASESRDAPTRPEP